MPCSICNKELFGYKDENFAANYPGLVCRKCDEHAVNAKGKKPKMDLDYDSGENPVFIDGMALLGFLWVHVHLSTEEQYSDSIILKVSEASCC